jgi:hypothetical protein
MTKAVCMNCGQLKFGAYCDCPQCGFIPKTLFDLTMSEMYSDNYVDENGLQKLSTDVKHNQEVLLGQPGALRIETAVYMRLEQRLADQSIRDMMTLVRKAKDGLFRKELNVHLVGPDGYESRIAVRGKDLDEKVFDSARSVGKGDVYLTYHYEAGKRQTAVVSKQTWYIFYDKMLLISRQGATRSAYLALLDAMYDEFLDNYLKYGAIFKPTKIDAVSNAEQLGAKREPLHPKTVDALKTTGMTEARYLEVDEERNAELATMDVNLRTRFHEQQKLFAEVEKASEIVSAAEIYGAAMASMNDLEFILKRGVAPAIIGEAEVVAAGMAKFLDRLYEVNDVALSQIEKLSAELCARLHDEVGLLGAKVTRVVVLGRVLNSRLTPSAPLCAHEAQWLAMTLLSDLDKLTGLQLGEPPKN